MISDDAFVMLYYKERQLHNDLVSKTAKSSF